MSACAGNSCTLINKTNKAGRHFFTPLTPFWEFPLLKKKLSQLISNLIASEGSINAKHC
jgi:hypothetical protein